MPKKGSSIRFNLDYFDIVIDYLDLDDHDTLYNERK